MVAKEEHLKNVAIVLVNWNGMEHTSKCLESLASVHYKEFDIIVVDNGSSKHETDTLREIDQITLIENGENLGFTGGNNVGIKYAYDAGYQLIMMLNNDTTVEPDFLDPLVTAMSVSSVGAVQPLILSMSHPTRIWSRGGIFSKWTGMPKALGEGQEVTADVHQSGLVEWLTGCCILFGREMVEEVGYLDDHFFALCEDVDWSFRVEKYGKELMVVPQSRIYHFQGASTNSQGKTKEGYRSPFRQYLNIRNHLYLLRKHPQKSLSITAYPYHMIRAMIFVAYYLLRGRWKKLRATLDALGDGLSQFRNLN